MTIVKQSELKSPGHQDAHSDAAFFTDSSLVDDDPPVEVIIVGTGLAGIITAIILRHKVNNLTLKIFDKNSQVGGTWAQNVYPGVRCDVPSHCYQTSFAPNTAWSEYYSKGPEIRAYYEKLATQHEILPHIRLRHQVENAVWDESAGLWIVSVKNLETGLQTTEKAPFFINAQGRLSKGKWPSIPGLKDFRGPMLHTSEWDPHCNLAGKRIAIIGNGASGQQILPNILPQVAHIDHYIRSKVWVSPTFQKNLTPATAAHPGGYTYTDEEKQRFAADPAYYLEYRRNIEALLHNRFPRTILGSKEYLAVREACVKTMEERLKGDRQWIERLTPDFAPGCKRLTPAPGYLEALQDDHVTYVDIPITHITEKGIVTTDGTEREADIVILATGFENGCIPYFPTVGKNKKDISQLWKSDGSVGYPQTYFDIMASDLPNYFFTMQAQGNGAGGSIPLQCEITAAYIAKVIKKVQKESYKSISPSSEAVRDFNSLCNGHFQDKVVSDKCSSWLKLDGSTPRSLVWWPGSSHHRFEVLRNPRWEDFSYERNSGSETNRYAFFGNGWTLREQSSKEITTAYLKEIGQINISSLHDAWDD